jgi:hypothetical protein
MVVYTDMVLLFVVMVTTFATGNFGTLRKFGEPSSTRLVSILRIAFGLTCGILILLVIGASIYCYYKMLWIILETSSKLAKMRRTENKNKVLALHRKLYSMIAFVAFLSVLLVLDFIFSRLTFLGSIVASIAAILLHLLELIRDSIQKVGERGQSELVTSLSSVAQLGDSEIEAMEMERIQKAGLNGNRN